MDKIKPEDGDRKTSLTPPTKQSAQISQRAASRKNRVYSFHSFLSQTYPKSKAVLDIAGGRGDLSFLLRNINDIDSIVADPRIPNFTRMIKSVDFLVMNPEEAKLRSLEGKMTFQPLATFIPLLLERQTCVAVSGDICNASILNLSIPKNMRINVDSSLVKALQGAIRIHNGEKIVSKESPTTWDQYWKSEAAGSSDAYYGGTAPKQKEICNYKSNQITDSKVALEVFRSLDLICGFHPDQATEAAIDLAIFLQIPFAVVPCCVFPSEFPDRMHNGKIVKSYNEFLAFLLTKHSKIKKSQLPFIGSDTAKSVVLYMLREDYYDDG